MAEAGVGGGGRGVALARSEACRVGSVEAPCEEEPRKEPFRDRGVGSPPGPVRGGEGGPPLLTKPAQRVTSAEITRIMWAG